ncbi:MAG: hypothetical protein ACJ8ER_01560 [Allosphingosinicella sp.]
MSDYDDPQGEESRRELIPADDANDVADEPFPWDAPGADEEPPPDSPRQRRDAFTEARKCVFLRALVKTGCLQEACSRTGTAPRTVYRHREQDGDFDRNCETALRMSAIPLELTAWKRAVDGVEEQVVVGGRILHRVRHSEHLLTLLLKGSDPAKYGPNPGFKRKRILKHERKQMEREIRAELKAEEEASRPTFEDAIVQLDKALDAFGARQEQAREREGWTTSPEGWSIPPGYGLIESDEAPEEDPPGSV